MGLLYGEKLHDLSLTALYKSIIIIIIIIIIQPFWDTGS